MTLDNVGINPINGKIIISGFKCAAIKPKGSFKIIMGDQHYNNPVWISKERPYSGGNKDMYSLGVILFAMAFGLKLDVIL